jgi:hypothetical protein
LLQPDQLDMQPGECSLVLLRAQFVAGALGGFVDRRFA